MTNPFISIIVPIYNSENYIRKCIDSILKQTFKNYELLLIDDESSDNSKTICDMYASDDKRIRVFHKPNGGASSARNYGILKSRGGFLTFIDSDDWIDEEHLNLMVKLVSSYDWIMVGMKYIRNGVINEIRGVTSNLVASTPQEFDNYYNKFPQLGFVTNKLYNANFIRKYNIFFSEDTHVHEDRLFNIEYSQYISNAIMLPENTYNYIDDNLNSLTHQKLTPPYMFVITANHMNKLIIQKKLGYNAQYNIARLMFKHFIHAFGCCIVYPIKSLSIIERLKLTQKVINSLYNSVILHGYTFSMIKWMFNDIRYFINRLSKK